MRLNGILIISSFFILIACRDTNTGWEGGAILETGRFSRDSIFIEVSTENHLVTYKMLDALGQIRLTSKHQFSDLHKWALYLDKDMSLWVISSDIGHSIWRFDAEKKEYSYFEFDHYLTKDEVPDELYSVLADLID